MGAGISVDGRRAPGPGWAQLLIWLEASLPGDQAVKTPGPQHPSWFISSDPINCGGLGAGMEFMAFPAWELSVGEEGSDLKTFSQKIK